MFHLNTIIKVKNDLLILDKSYYNQVSKRLCRNKHHSLKLIFYLNPRRSISTVCGKCQLW